MKSLALIGALAAGPALGAYQEARIAQDDGALVAIWAEVENEELTSYARCVAAQVGAERDYGRMSFAGGRIEYGLTEDARPDGFRVFGAMSYEFLPTDPDDPFQADDIAEILAACAENGIPTALTAEGD